MKEISMEEVLQVEKLVLVDVRSPAEFTEATIPGAINIPLLDDEERVKVGTTYKQVGTEAAQDLGLQLVAPKLPAMLGQLKELAKHSTLVVFCWRGGMRSKVVYDFAKALDIQTVRLIGGYKSYRRYVNNFLQAPALPGAAVVLHGHTGVGKTDILDLLHQKGTGVLDLEGLANNRGSAFGGIGLAGQPSQKMFEAKIVEVLASPVCQHNFVVECESKRIGRLYLPDLLFKSMTKGVHILLYATLGKRIERLVELYCSDPSYHAELKKGVTSLSPRLGKNKAEELKNLIDKGNYQPFIEYLLINYYDPLYKYPYGPSDNYALSVCTDNPEAASLEIASFLATK